MNTGRAICVLLPLIFIAIRRKIKYLISLIRKYSSLSLFHIFTLFRRNSKAQFIIGISFKRHICFLFFEMRKSSNRTGKNRVVIEIFFLFNTNDGCFYILSLS